MMSTGCKWDAGQSERERATFGEVWIEERFSVEKTFEWICSGESDSQGDDGRNLINFWAKGG